MVSVPNPFEFVKGRVEVDSDAGEVPGARTLVGGRHGSPNVIVSLPLSSIWIKRTDPALRESLTELRGAVAELAGLVAALARTARDAGQEDEARSEFESIHVRAAKLADLVLADEGGAD